MTTIQHPTSTPLHSGPGVHRHTDECFWDLFDARWRCPERRPVGDDHHHGRLPRVLVEPRRRPPSPRTPPTGAHLVRLRTGPGVDDGC